jgi:DNA-binding transcriptional LysR family regulator
MASNELKFLRNNVTLLYRNGTPSFKYFIALAEELQFARAASRLHITERAFSKQIQQLEEELGFPLFCWTKQRFKLLDAGHVLLDEARRIS